MILWRCQNNPLCLPYRPSQAKDVLWVGTFILLSITKNEPIISQVDQLGLGTYLLSATQPKIESHARMASSSQATTDSNNANIPVNAIALIHGGTLLFILPQAHQPAASVPHGWKSALPISAFGDATAAAAEDGIFADGLVRPLSPDDIHVDTLSAGVA